MIYMHVNMITCLLYKCRLAVLFIFKKRKGSGKNSQHITMSSLHGDDCITNPMHLPHDGEEQQDNELKGIEKQIETNTPL